MTQPRQVLFGKTYLVTRRTSQRMFLLKPSRLTNQLVMYCLARAAEETDIVLHTVCFLSDHWHGVISDPFARLPEFLERFHRLFARSQNAALDRSENLWSSDKPSVVLLESDEDILDKMAYTIANPTAAGLVASPEQWPGVMTRGFKRPSRVEMPDVFFDVAGDLPEDVELTFERPPAYQHLDDIAFARLLNLAVREKVRRARAELAQQGRSFLGVEGVLRQSFFSMPTTPARRRKLSPRFAGRNPAIRERLMLRLASFLRSYREARLKWRDGDRNVCFPAGTYALRVQACVRCSPLETG